MAEKAYLETESGGRINCLFNPGELQISMGTDWGGEPVPGQPIPSLRFRGGQSGSISLELFFDTTDTGQAVTSHTNALIKLTQVDTSLPGYAEAKSNGRPPWVKFHWGSFHSFRCVVASLSLTFVYFAADGTPLRAKASMTLTQYEPDANWPAQNPTSGTPKPMAAHQVQPGEHLALLAARYYGDATKWRLIASGNQITDPFRLRPGAILDIPRLDES
ncbi:MAG: LysM peptidoglycan-binding domain-containing protein [Ilumatobacteraceae bacterium]